MRANSKSWQKNSINIIADAILTTNGEQKNDRSTQNGSVKQYCDNCVISGQDMQLIWSTGGKMPSMTTSTVLLLRSKLNVLVMSIERASGMSTLMR